MIINCQGLHHRYGRHYVLRGVDLTINAGGITGLCAPNGEGKTTLLKTICGLQFPDSGTIEVLGHRPGDRRRDFLQRVYYLSSEPFFPKWTARKIADLYAPLYPNFNRELYGKLLREFRMSDDQPLDKVSFGQKRRVQLAFALATRTQLLLLDEPTVGLDIQGKDQFRRALIEGTEAGQTIIIATHLLDELGPVLDGLVILQNGQTENHLDLAMAESYYSFNHTTTQPGYDDLGYARRVPGGWLTIHTDGRPSNTALDFETLYLALSEGTLRDPATLTPKA